MQTVGNMVLQMQSSLVAQVTGIEKHHIGTTPFRIVNHSHHPPVIFRTVGIGIPRNKQRLTHKPRGAKL